jgi:periodic tryptophan protein 2
MQFSPDSKFVAIAIGKKIRVYQTPECKRQFAGLYIVHKFHNLHSEDVTQIQWSPDSRFFLSMSKDLSIKIVNLHNIPGYIPIALNAHRSTILTAFFSENMQRIYSISRDGITLIWKWTEELISEEYKKQLQFSQKKLNKRIKLDAPQESTQLDFEYYTEFEKNILKGRFVLEKKEKFELSGTQIKSATYHTKANILAIGLMNGIFAVYSIDPFTPLHSFKIADNKINAIDINHKGNWIAFASQEQGQMFVWDWKTESYILKQQGHFFDVNTVAYSPNGNIIASGSDDGKIKLWDTKSGFCFATFDDHKGPITSIKFMPKKGNAIISSSLDGTVRAFDLIKYKNFRIMTEAKLSQYGCLEIDETGDLVCAGTNESFHICVWQLKSAAIVDVLTGHTSTISCLAFGSLKV